jgi:hypothetical protein
MDTRYVTPDIRYYDRRIYNDKVWFVSDVTPKYCGYKQKTVGIEVNNMAGPVAVVTRSE